LDLNFDPNPNYLSYLFQALSIIQFARILDWVVSNYFIHRKFARRDETIAKGEGETKDTEGNATKMVQYLVYILAIILILENLNFDPTIFSVDLKDNQVFNLKISNVLAAIVIFYIGRLIIWVITHLILYGYYKRKSIDIGGQYAINQLISYVGYFIIILAALGALGLNVNLFWGGAAALLVGVGLGLQQTFNDFFSGIVLFFERTVKVGDVVQMQGFVGTIRKIGLRASIVESRDSVSVIVPNSKLVNLNVVNWSHTNGIVRFSVKVGVAYGSNTKLVKKLLLEAANTHEDVLKYPAPFVRFEDFANSSLMFMLFYFSKKLIAEEDVKSDLRFHVDELFRANSIKIPFPQSEIYLHNED
jgi:small-conductance mechanosensitive channel